MAEIEYYQGVLTGEEIDALPNRLGNRNLLDNWYFPNPVNQRGQTIYNESGSVYTIDRWIKRNTVTVSPQTDGLHLTYADDTQLKGLNQPFTGVDIQQLVGKTVTVSVLVKDVNFPTATSSYPIFGLFSSPYNFAHSFGVVTGRIRGDGLWSATGVVTESALDYAFINFTLCYSNVYPGTITIVAAKLELGESQTLAHMVNGEWQLNDIPSFQEELAKCQRYLYIVNSNKNTYVDVAPYAHATSAAAIFPLVPLPVPLRASSVNDITISDFAGVLLRPPSGTAVTPTNITPYRICGGALKLSVSASGLTAGNPYVLGYAGSASSQFIISCEL